MKLKMQSLFLIKMSNVEIQREVFSSSKNNLRISNNYLQNSNVQFSFQTCCLSTQFFFSNLNIFLFDLVISQNSFGSQRITLNFKN